MASWQVTLLTGAAMGPLKEMKVLPLKEMKVLVLVDIAGFPYVGVYLTHHPEACGGPALWCSRCSLLPSNAICIFYLVLRALDTVEDDMSIPLAKKVSMLQNFHLYLYEPDWCFLESKEKHRQVLEDFPTVWPGSPPRDWGVSGSFGSAAWVLACLPTSPV